MSEDLKSILVPIDFTASTTNALNYAIEAAKGKSLKLHALHVANSNNEVDAAEAKLKNLISNHKDSGITIESVVVVGNIYTKINEIGEQYNCVLIVMGIRNASTYQKIFGSKSINVVTETKIPFLTVQADSKYTKIDKVVLTIDTSKESIQIIKNLVNTIDQFNPELIFVAGQQDDDEFKRKINVNILLATKYANEHHFKNSVEFLDRNNFSKNLLNFCLKNNVNAIASTYHHDNFQVFSAKFIQNLFENDLKIPIITVNSKAVTNISSVVFQ